MKSLSKFKSKILPLKTTTLPQPHFGLSVDTVPVLVWEANSNAIFKYFNQAWLDFTGRTQFQESVYGWTKGIHPEDNKHCLKCYFDAFTLQQKFTIEFRLRQADGKYGWLLNNGYPQFDIDGTFLGYMGACLNVTESKIATEIKRVSEEKFRTIATHPDYWEYWQGVDGEMIHVSPSCEKITGYHAEDFFSDSQLLKKIVHPDDALLMQQHLVKINAPAHLFLTEEIDIKIIKKDGTEVNIAHLCTPVLDDNGNLLGRRISNTDITERKKVETDLTKNERRYRGLLNNLEAGVVIHAADTAILMSNPKAAELLGISEDQMMEKISNDPQWQFLTETGIPLSIEKYPVNQIIHSKQLLKDFLIGIHRPLTGNIVWLLVNGFPVLNNKEEVTEVLISFIDITERKKVEVMLQQTVEDLKASNSNLENFAFIASHDLQEPLRMVNSFLKLLEKKLEHQLNDTTRQYIHFATDGATRMKMLIDDLLKYSKVTANKDEFLETDLDEMLDYLLRTLREPIEKSKAVIIIYSLPFIWCNKILINQLFLNLLNNALKYNEADAPVIEVGYTEQTEEYIFYVTDNGIGINEEYFNKIFILFQRLHGKTEYSGTGIGLALCKKIVEIHNGKIWLESEEGKGTTFYFSIPKLPALTTEY